jgi:hypothetical protein
MFREKIQGKIGKIYIIKRKIGGEYFIKGRKWQIPHLRAFAFSLHRNKYR